MLRLSLLRYVGKGVKIVGWIAVVYVIAAWYLIPYVDLWINQPKVVLETQIFTSEGLARILATFVPLGVLIWIGGHLDKLSGEKKSQLEDRLIGFMKSYEKIPLNELAYRVGLSPLETERTLATIRSEREVNFAIADGCAIWEREMCKNCPRRLQKEAEV